MPSKRYRDNSYSGKDRIPFESPADSDIDMKDGQFFDRQRGRRSSTSHSRPESTRSPMVAQRRRRRNSPSNAKSESIRNPIVDQRRGRRSSPSNARPKSRRSPMRNDRFPESDFGRHDTHGRYANNYIPRVSSFGSQAHSFLPQRQSKLARDVPYRYGEDPYCQPTTARRSSSSIRRSSSSPGRRSSLSRRRSSSIWSISPISHKKSFSTSEATTAYYQPLSNRHSPASPSARAKVRKMPDDSSDKRSDLGSRSYCKNRVALSYEKDHHGDHFRMWRVRKPTGETVTRERILEYSVDGEKKRNI